MLNLSYHSRNIKIFKLFSKNYIKINKITNTSNVEKNFYSSLGKNFSSSVNHIDKKSKNIEEENNNTDNKDINNYFNYKQIKMGKNYFSN